MENVQKDLQGGLLLFTMSPQQLFEQIRLIVREERTIKSEIDLSPPPGMSNKPLYTFAEIRKLFSISKPTVYQWISAGKLHPVKIRNRVYFRGSEVDGLIR